MAPNIAREARQAITLIKSFSLELGQYSPESQVLYWLNTYPAAWIRDAIIEAVYQGRYKVISVQHILSIWQKRGQPIHHFTSGFEQVIASHIGSPIHLSPSSIAPLKAKGKKTSKPHTLKRDDFAPSPLSSSVLSSLPVESDILSRNDYPGLSIEAFPVKHMETLVDVYQAVSPQRTPAAKSRGLPTKGRINREPVMARVNDSTLACRADDNEHSAMSSPIQPFRPAPHDRTYG